MCVVGESGCGKTVTAMTVLKLLPMPPGKIVAGQVLWQGRDLVPREQRRDAPRPRQGDRDDLPGADDLAQPGLHASASRSPRSLRLHEGLGRKAALERAVEMLALVRIPTPSAASTTTRTSSPAACASA